MYIIISLLEVNNCLLFQWMWCTGNGQNSTHIVDLPISYQSKMYFSCAVWTEFAGVQWGSANNCPQYIVYQKLASSPFSVSQVLRGSHWSDYVWTIGV